MQYLTKDFGQSEYAYIVPLSDLHIGEEGFDEARFIEFRDWIRDTPNTYAILVGDILNCATKTSKSDIYGEKLNPSEAKRKAISILSPIKEKILASVSGNHEFRVYRESGNDIAEDLAVMLGVPYAREGVLINMKFRPYDTKGAVNYTLYATHGHGGGGTKGSKTNVLNRMASIIEADIYICGHIHFMTTFSDYRFMPDIQRGRINRVKHTYVSSAGFLKWGGYAEQMMLPPGKLGAPRIRLSGIKKDFHVSI